MRHCVWIEGPHNIIPIRYFLTEKSSPCHIVFVLGGLNMPRPEVLQTGRGSRSFPALRSEALRTLPSLTHVFNLVVKWIITPQGRGQSSRENGPIFLQLSPLVCLSASLSNSLLKLSFLFQAGKRRGDGNVLHSWRPSLTPCSLFSIWLTLVPECVQDGNALPAQSKICPVSVPTE